MSHVHMMFKTFLYKVDDGDATYLVAALSRKDALKRWARHTRSRSSDGVSCRKIRQTKRGVTTWHLT